MRMDDIKEDAEQPADHGVKESSLSQVKPVGILLSKTHVLIASICAVLLIAGGTFFGMWLKDYLLERSGIDPNAKDYQFQQSSPAASSEQIAIPGYRTVHFPANEKNVDIILPNPEGNPCYFRFRLVLRDTGEVLYESKLIPPGKALREISLSRSLAAGEYNLDICIEAVTLTSDRAPMNGANLEVTLVVR